MTSLWASISPLNHHWPRNPFTIRITYENVGECALTGIRLVIVGDNPLGEEIIVPAIPLNREIGDQYTNHNVPASNSQAHGVTRVYTLILHLDLIDLPNYSAPYRRIEVLSADAFRASTHNGLAILFNHVYLLNTGADKNPLEIVLAHSHLSHIGRTAMFDSWWRTRNDPLSIHIQILHTCGQTNLWPGGRNRISSQLIDRLPIKILQTIARNLLSDVTPERSVFPSWLLSMSLTQKSWLHLLDEFTWFLELGILFRNSKLLPSLLEARPHWKPRIRRLYDASFFLPPGWKDADLKLERRAFIRSIQGVHASLERLELDIESLLSLSEDIVSEGMVWKGLRNLKVEGAQSTGDRESLRIDGLAHALRLFPGVGKLVVSALMHPSKRRLTDSLASPAFNLESFTLSRSRLDCRNLPLLFPLASPPASGLNLTTLSFTQVDLHAPEELAHLFRMTSATLRDLTIIITDNSNDDEELTERGPSLLDHLPMTMEKLRRIRIAARYVTPAIIQNMRSRRTGSGEERTCLEISEYTTSIAERWEEGPPRRGIREGREGGIEDGGKALGGSLMGQELYEAIEATEWDEVVFSGVYLEYGRNIKRLAEIVNELAGPKGYTIVKARTSIKMSRVRE